MRRLTLLAGIFLGCALVAGCEPTAGPTVSRRQVGRAYTERIDEGRVIRAEVVTIEGGGSGLGAVVGGVTGYALGKDLTRGKSSLTKVVVRGGGAVAGAAGGSAIQQSASRRQGIEIGVKLDSGETVVVIQDVEPNREFRVGDEVRVYRRSDGTARVMQ
jgi:outer membrane lipoprotein SlyB